MRQLRLAHFLFLEVIMVPFALLFIGFILVAICALVTVHAQNRSCAIWLIGVAGLVMIVIGVIILTTSGVEASTYGGTQTYSLLLSL